MKADPQQELGFEAHRILVYKLFSVRPHVMLTATAGLLLVGGAAALRTGDPLLLSLAIFGCAANVLLLWFVRGTDVGSVQTAAKLRQLEQSFFVGACASCATIGAMAMRALLVSNDALIHLALIALGLAAVATSLRNYFSPRLVPAQIALLVWPACIAMALQERAIYWAVSLAGLLFGYVVKEIAAGLHREAIESLRKDRILKEQNVRFEAALSNMAQGLCMFDQRGELVVFNDRYLQLYGFSSAVIKAGVSLKTVIDHSKAVGNHPNRSAAELLTSFTDTLAVPHPIILENDLGDGRIIALAHQPLEGGGWVTTHEDITERKAAAKRVAHLARHDPLTDLPNRSYFGEMLQQQLDAAGCEPLAIFCLDLDRFKAVNDTLGHAAGDAVLTEIAARIRSCTNANSFVARLGGDEFAIVQHSVAQPAGATTLADKILSRVGRPIEVDGRQLSVGASIGIELADPGLRDANKAVRNADVALYRAKAEGRNRYRFFESEMDEWLHTRRHLEMDLRRAVANAELALVYQPIFDATSRALTSFEALLRWHHPNRGTIQPADFISIAEETGLISSIGEWAIRTAAMDAATWPSHLKLAVNLSPAQISSPNLLPTLTTALAAAQVAPSRLELEITENVLLGETSAVISKLHALRSMGVKIVMDDFGTGYSSLSNLRAFPFDKIKIDQSFVRDLADPEALAIVRAVRDLGRTFQMSVTAEGVETDAQLLQLQSEGCDEVQGYLLGRPMPVAQVRSFIKALQNRAVA